MTIGALHLGTVIYVDITTHCPPARKRRDIPIIAPSRRANGARTFEGAGDPARLAEAVVTVNVTCDRSTRQALSRLMSKHGKESFA